VPSGTCSRQRRVAGSLAALSRHDSASAQPRRTRRAGADDSPRFSLTAHCCRPP
jgi:hypothetical protein